MSKKIKKDEIPIPVGTRVRFTRNGLGGSPRDELHAFSGEVFGRTDEGVVAFRHPGADNKALSHTWGTSSRNPATPASCRSWTSRTAATTRTRPTSWPA